MKVPVPNLILYDTTPGGLGAPYYSFVRVGYWSPQSAVIAVSGDETTALFMTFGWNKVAIVQNNSVLLACLLSWPFG